MLQAPWNNILVRIGDVFIKRVSDIVKVSASEAHGSNLNPADLVQIVGEVVSVPKGISHQKRGYEGYSVSDVKVGDTAIFRYDVVFAFSGDKRKFKNMFYYRGEEYWLCDVVKLFAVIRRGEIRMQNGYCMVENMPELPKIILPQAMHDLTAIHSATLTQIGSNLEHLPAIGALPGDTIFYKPVNVQKYEIKGKPFGIIQQSNIMGYNVAEYSGLIN